MTRAIQLFRLIGQEPLNWTVQFSILGWTVTSVANEGISVVISENVAKHLMKRIERAFDRPNGPLPRNVMKTCRTCIYMRRRLDSDRTHELAYKNAEFWCYCPYNDFATMPELCRCGGENYKRFKIQYDCWAEVYEVVEIKTHALVSTHKLRDEAEKWIKEQEEKL